MLLLHLQGDVKMKKISRYIISILIITLSFSVGVIGAYAYEINYSNGYSDFYGDGMTVRINSSFASESKVAVDNSLDEWSTAASLGNHMFRGSDHSITTHPKKDGVNAITKSDVGPDYLMVCNYTSVNILTRYIYEFDINVNTYYPWKNNGDSDAYDVENVMTHEIGHALGIGHSDVSGATMKQGSSLGMISKRTIEADDIAAAAYIY